MKTTGQISHYFPGGDNGGHKERHQNNSNSSKTVIPIPMDGRIRNQNQNQKQQYEQHHRIKHPITIEVDKIPKLEDLVKRPLLQDEFATFVFQKDERERRRKIDKAYPRIHHNCIKCGTDTTLRVYRTDRKKPEDYWYFVGDKSMGLYQCDNCYRTGKRRTMSATRKSNNKSKAKNVKRASSGSSSANRNSGVKASKAGNSKQKK